MKTHLCSILCVAITACCTVLPRTLPGGYRVVASLGTDRSVNTHYTGTIWATGGAIADMNRFIEKMDPLDIGTLEPDQLVIAGYDTHEDEVFSFKSVTCFRVTMDSDTFTVFSMRAEKEDEHYHIIFELRGGPHFDRSIHIFKDNQPYMLILWKDTLRLKPQKPTGI